MFTASGQMQARALTVHGLLRVVPSHLLSLGDVECKVVEVIGVTFGRTSSVIHFFAGKVSRMVLERTQGYCLYSCVVLLCLLPIAEAV